MGRQVRKCPIECADRGAGGTHDDDVVFHLKLLSLSKFLGGTRFLAPPHPRRPCGPVNMTCLSNIRDNWVFSAFPQGILRYVQPCRGAIKRWPIEVEIGYAQSLGRRNV